MQAAFDLSVTRKIPKWVYVFWIFIVLLILCIVIQQATMLFYGPTRVVQGHFYEYNCDVSRDWLKTILFIPVLFAWFALACARALWLALLVILVTLIYVLVAPAIVHEISWTGGGASGWFSNDLPRNGLFANESFVQFVADPAAEIAHYLKFVFLAAWILLVLNWERLRNVPTGLCRNCGYDLRATPSGICPECGDANRKLTFEESY